MFHVFTTPHFERELKKLCKKNASVVLLYERGLNILEIDPYNSSKLYKIKKLRDVKDGERR